jgi:hypothetical protein
MVTILRQLLPVVAFLLIGLIGCLNRVDSAQNGSESQQQFAQAYVVALQSHDPARVKKLMHPQLLACENAATQEFFESGIQHEFDNVPGPGYKITVSPLPSNAVPPLVPPGTFKYPVQPTNQLQIDWTRNGNALSIDSIVQPIALKDGKWYLVDPCPTEAGLKLFREQMAAGTKQTVNAHKLASELKDPLKSDILGLLQQGRKIDAIKRYQSATGADLTTAVTVINILDGTSH